ncbi:MAG TPA: Hsp20/alpha crystallin family protein [Bacteroidia bacterium]|jgi:HSP20 family protein|nr:Hsp20/alpha crystallin family protein [Bacteroidia bacterium]
MTLIKWSKPNGGLNRSEDIYSWPFLTMNDFFSSNHGGKASFVPSVNISEKADAYQVELSVPGFNKEDFKIEAEKDVLRVSCEHKEEKKDETKQFTRREFRYGSFSRSFTLPENANVEAIKASYENGILVLDIPKKEIAKDNNVKEIKVS